MLTNKLGIPLPLAVWLAAPHDYDLAPDPRVISATTLQRPLKSIILGQRVLEEGSVDIHDLIASKLGTAIHSAVEKAWLEYHRAAMTDLGYPPAAVAKTVVNPPDTMPKKHIVPVYVEQRHDKEVMGYRVSGKYDIVIDGVLNDVKSTSTYTWIMGSSDDKWIKQGSIYRWLAPEIITEDYMYINYLFTDWSPLKAKADPIGYPQSRALPKKLNLMSIEETDKYVKERLQIIDQYMQSPQDELPECLEEDLWVDPTKYAYYKNPQKTARATAVLATKEEALEYQSTKGKGEGFIVERTGQVRFCRYCPANIICNQAERYIHEGRLNI